MSNSQTLSTVLLLLVGSGGIGAAIMAIVKLPRERNSAAVTEAQGNAQTATTLLREVRQERDEWRDRALRAEREMRDLGRGRT
jgi:CBS domain containing-hemolysin-like protein